MSAVLYDRADYHAKLRIMADKTAHPPPILHTVDGKKVVIALEHKNSETRLLKKALKLARSIDHCNTCQERVHKFFPLSIPDKDGRPMPLFLSNPETTPEPYDELARMNQTFCCETEITGIRILTGDLLLGCQEEEGDDPREEGRLYHHFHVRLPDKTDWDVNNLLLDKAFRRYCPELLPNMLRMLIPSTTHQIKASLECIRDCIPEITYGEKIAPSVAWLLRVVDRFDSLPAQLTPAQKWLFCAEILLWTPISPDGLDESSAVSCIIQQAHNNVLPVMSSANNRPALIKILNHRLSPVHYQRRTAAPTEGQVNNAIAGLGDFTNTIMTLSEAAKIPGAVVMGSGGKSSMSAFQSMIKEAVPVTLADKCGPAIHGICDLVRYARDHPDSKIHLDGSALSSVYVASTTLSPERLAVPYMWSFQQDTSYTTKVFPFGGKWTEIAVILPQYETMQYKNTLFLLRGCHHLPVEVKNCCFPEFLSVAVRRVCGAAFEMLNNKIRLPVPTVEPAIGRGTSVSGTDKLISPVRVLVEGREFTLTTM